MLLPVRYDWTAIGLKRGRHVPELNLEQMNGLKVLLSGGERV